MNINELLLTFLKSKMRNAWIENEIIKVYVRKGRHILAGEVRTTLDIAAVSVQEEFSRQGIFKSFLKFAHETNPFQATFVECVHNEILASFLLRNGWTQTEESFFLKKIGS